jgi:O-antigen/teichoic acid export membrane protein
VTGALGRHRLNISANYVGTIGVAAVQLMSIPAFVSQLGAHTWGLLSAILALSSALMVLEAGVGLAISRHFSLFHIGVKDSAESFKRLERGYLSTSAVVVFSGLVVGVPLLGWLRLDAQQVTGTTMALTFAMAGAQIAGGLYRSVLVGTGFHIALNAILIGSAVLRFGLALLAASAGASLAVIVGCLALGALAETAARRAAARVALSRRPNIEVPGVGASSPMAAGAWALAAAGAIGALATQLDRLLLSRVVEPAELGAYSIAVTLSLAALQLVYPLTVALIPKLQLFRQQSGDAGVYIHTYAAVVALLSIVWLVAAVVVVPGLGWWLPDEELARSVRPLFWLHLVGTSLNALCVPLYLGLLSNHRDVAIAVTALVALVVQLAVLAAAVRSAGVAAGAWAWCAGNFTLLLAYVFLAKKA